MKRRSFILLLSVLLFAFVSTHAQEVGVDRPGQDLRPGFDLERPDPALCKQACERDPNCKAYTYVKPGYQGRNARCCQVCEYTQQK